MSRMDMQNLLTICQFSYSQCKK